MLPNLVRSNFREIKQLHHGELTKERASEYGTPEEEVLDFSTNVNPLGPPRSVLNCIKENLGVVSRYPPHEPKKLRHILADYSGTLPERIVLGNGSTELINLLTRIFLDKNDEAVIAEPTFTEYSKAVKIQGGRERLVRLKEEEGYKPQSNQLLEKISRKTKLVFLCSPNNPTGRIIPLDVLKDMVEACEDYGALLVLDEAFYEYCDHPQKYNVAEMGARNLVSVRSLTKFYALAGLRIGYMIAPDPLSKIMRGVQTRWNVNFLALLAAQEAVRDTEFSKRTKRETNKGKRFLRKKLKKFSGLRTYPSSANFFLINLSVANITSAEIVGRLLRKGIAVRDCSDFKFLDENYIRISTRPLKDCKKLIEGMEEINSEGDLERVE